MIPHLCSAIITLFESYSLSLKAQQQVLSPNDLILQIIPLDLVASPNAIILPSPLAYRRLAFEVYDRCPPDPFSDKANSSRYLCAPSVQLARKLPKTINLKLSSEPSASLLQSDFCFHLAYSWDPDREWLIASWTDNQGSLQWNTPYSLGVGEIEGCWPILLNVLKEIWETTLEMLHPRNSPWRLYIAKDSPMYKKELEGKPYLSPNNHDPRLSETAAWLSISTLPQKHPITSTFITIDSSPPLRFPPPPLPKISLLPTPNVYSTPSSTPAAQTVSPDPTGLVSTPGSNLLNPPTPTPASGPPDGDTDARLIDITDESWGLVLPVANVDALLPPWLCGPLASGYLLKRGGTRDEDGLLAIGVNVVHAELKGIDPLLRDVLGMYRDLAALARIRGVVDRVKGMLPWHVAAARRAGASINRLMTWDGEGKS